MPHPRLDVERQVRGIQIPDWSKHLDTVKASTKKCMPISRLRQPLWFLRKFVRTGCGDVFMGQERGTGERVVPPLPAMLGGVKQRGVR